MRILSVVPTVLAAAALLSTPVHADERLSIGTGGTGGLFYVIGAGMADTINQHVPDTTARAEVTGASVENIRRVSAGQMQFGLSSSSTLYEGKNGMGPFNGQTMDVAAVAYLYPAVLQVATIDKTGITDISELAGHRVSMGPPGSNAAVLAQRLFEAYGVFDGIQPRFLSYNEGVSALANGQVDATVVLAGAPTAALIDLDSQQNMRLLGVDAATVADMLKQYPFYQLEAIPAGTYGDQTSTVIMINDPATLFTAASASDDLVYRITAALFDHLDQLGAVHPQAAAISAETAPRTPIDLHPGAARYFDEH
ncbi:TAXI family TRAP transporter solute-binding subunit [Saccharospirillum mangrovi]|uniref:TAXI family TRAP transporter solute-binding subunit n=1 Tax=Saccharospirillum mangrovi TaxID=2161747 RepID=UPI000D3A8BD6|nr:TAXI family TRAP transporter solute-binding subunit [Saccharospirillum mangrovi]